MVNKNNYDEKIQNAVNSLLRMFETGEMPQAIARTVINKSGLEIPSDNWSLGNRVIMYANETLDGRAFKQWESAGRKIKKGAKAFYILAPNTKKVEIENKETKEKEEKIIVTGFRTIPVFRYEDTEGEPIQYPDYTPEELPPLYEVAQALGIDIKYVPFTNSCYGSYHPVKNNIQLHTHDYKTFFHELGHAVHNTFKTLKGGQHAEQEIVAEMVAATICQVYKIEGYEYHSYKYIASYCNDKSPKEIIKTIMQVLNDVEKVLNKIFEIAETINLKEAI